MGVPWMLRRIGASVWADLVVWGAWLVVVVASLLLPLYLGVNYLAERGCHPHINLQLNPGTFEGIDLSSVLQRPNIVPVGDLDLTSLTGDNMDANTEFQPSLLEGILPPQVELYLSHTPTGNQTESNITERVVVDILPRHLYKKGEEFAMIQLQPYSQNPHKSVLNLCQVNGKYYKTILTMGVSVCEKALLTELDNNHVEKLLDFVSEISPEQEDTVIEAVMSGNLTNVMGILPSIFPNAGLSEEDVLNLKTLISPFTLTELGALMSAADDLENMDEVLAKINVDNIPGINEALNELGIDFGQFLGDPAILFKFLGDEDKKATLIKLQTLLPRFTADDIETFLVFKEKLDAVEVLPGDKAILEKMFTIPMDQLFGTFEVVKELMGDEQFHLLTEVAGNLTLTSPEGQQKLIASCTQESIQISCVDKSKDVCPWGHLFLGAASLAPLAVPGILYSMSCLFHYRGTLMQCGIGKPFTMPSTRLDFVAAWILLLPLYLLFMIPWTLCIIIYRQLAVWTGLSREIIGGNKVDSDSELIMNASSFGLLAGAGHGFLHIGVQVLVLGFVLTLGSLMEGIDQGYFGISTSWVTLCSILLTCLVLGVSHLSSQEAGRISRDLSTPSDSLPYLTTSLAWLVASTIISLGSTLGLVVLCWVDTVGGTTWSLSVLTALLLLLLPPAQCVLYQVMVREGSEHRFTWGIFAALIPVRFLDVEKKRARNFLLLSQLLWLFIHLLAWMGYSLHVYLTPPFPSLMFSLYLPVLVPLLVLPPILACLHWSTSLGPLYDSYHAHPDMADTLAREDTFPPDWPQISGSTLAPSHMADAGFFYSCRRLRTPEATCYSCGRQVTEWAGRTATQAHRQIADHCPLYNEETDKKKDLSTRTDRSTASYLAEFVFIGSTVIFRVASFALLIWVFEDHWLQVSPSVPTQYLLPPLYLLVLLLLNPALFYSCLGPSATPLSSLLSILVPLPHHAPLPWTRNLLAANLALNALIIALLWAAMIATCPACALILSFSRLQIVCPILLGLAAISALSSLPFWYLSLRPLKPHPRPTTSTSVYVVSTSL